VSSSSSRKLPADVLAHPDVVSLVDHGRSTGEVTAVAVREASESAAISPQHLKALLRMLSEEGVTVVVSADESTARKQVAAAASNRSTVKASTKPAAKKAPAKKAAAKKAPAKKAPAKKAAAKKAPAKRR
jgi:RNA polymerase primary sigma factor